MPITGGNGTIPQNISTGFGSTVSQYPIVTPRSYRTTMPPYGTMEVWGTSSVTNGQNTTTNGIIRDTYLCPFAIANQKMGNRYVLTQYGYSGQTATYVLEQLSNRLSLGNPADITVWWGAANDMGSDSQVVAALQTSQTAVRRIIEAGSCPLVVLPHNQIDNLAKWRRTAWYDQIMQEWCMANRVAFVSGAYAICAHTDKLGTPKSGVMSDNLHFNAKGSLYYVDEIIRTFNYGPVWRLLGIANGSGTSEWEGQLHENPKMAGSTSVSGTGISGTRCENISPSRYNGSSILCACSVGVDAMDGSYMDLDITVPAGTSGSVQAIQCPEFIPQANFLPNKTYAHMVDYEVVSNPEGLIRNVQIRFGFSGTPAQNIDHISGTPPDLAAEVGRYNARSRRWTSAQASPAATTFAGLLIFTQATVEGTSKIRIRANGTRETQELT